MELIFYIIFCVAYSKCIAPLWRHPIYLFVYKSQAPVTWSSVVAILVVNVVCGNFFSWLFRKQVLLTEANTPSPDKCYKCSLCKSFYISKDNI